MIAAVFCEASIPYVIFLTSAIYFPDYLLYTIRSNINNNDQRGFRP